MNIKTTAILVVISVTIACITGLVISLFIDGGVLCATKTDNFNFAYKHNAFTGCYVRVKGRWQPLGNFVEFTK